LENGSPDPSYNAPPAEPVGQVQNGTGAVRAVALTGDGRSVTVGYTPADALGNTDLVVTRRLANGALDPSFSPGGADGDGIVITDFTGSGTEAVADVLALPGGKVLAVGSHNNGASGFDLALARYNADGLLDTTSGGAG